MDNATTSASATETEAETAAVLAYPHHQIRVPRKGSAKYWSSQGSKQLHNSSFSVGNYKRGIVILTYCLRKSTTPLLKPY